MKRRAVPLRDLSYLFRLLVAVICFVPLGVFSLFSMTGCSRNIIQGYVMLSSHRLARLDKTVCRVGSCGMVWAL